MDDLERDIDRALRQLPAPRAPRTLMARVMLAVAQAEARPWYARAWVTWPHSLQAASAAALVLAVAGLWWITSSGHSWIPDGATAGAERAIARFAPAARVAEQAATLSRVFWQVWLQPIAAYLFALLIMLSVICAALWTAVNRVALDGAATRN